MFFKYNFKIRLVSYLVKPILSVIGYSFVDDYEFTI